ncbi:hypothetical protein CCR97_07945 [Rhodoplanes elegans]|uniref:Uncharacterized protein n=1 Tax=Rhodoplanes elegans TaxID=29408 RepID=A0A327KNG1_9BRAD|nr:hypothetical protein [Rhodoplanes elegans]MBK5958050.1 hypothetical protein [Rhodoplanes elegans]MBK5958142.1 hypothetical protein [Rhodoplanes elegans]RAI40429.1 hypothetical protein CH338_06195 [Rhodoplanes elegans]
MPDLRHDDAGAIDEVVARGADVQIERMSGSSWFVCITDQDGSETRFFINAKNPRARVNAINVQTSGAGPAREQGNGWVER